MALHLEIEHVLDNLDLYEERELMFIAWEKKTHKKKYQQKLLMPEVELVHRVLTIPVFNNVNNNVGRGA
jgi:hypothetical protein